MTVPPESKTRRRPGACTHLDMVGDSAIAIFPTFTMCSICGMRWEENGARLRCTDPADLKSPPSLDGPILLERMMRKLDPP